MLALLFVIPQLKKTHPWYSEIYSQVLQDVVKRVKVTFDRSSSRIVLEAHTVLGTPSQ